MATARAMKKSFYTQSQGAPSIEMPPLPDEPTNQKMGAVPDEVPKEVQEEMNNEQANNQDHVQEQVHQAQEKVDQLEQQEQNLREEQENSSESDTDESSTDQSETDQSETDQSVTEKKTEGPRPQDSFKAIREAKEKAERERDILMQQMLEYQKSQQQQQPKQPESPPVDDDINFDIDEDGLVEGRYVKKVTNKIKNLEKQLKNYESQAQQQSTEAKIKSQYPDFDKVVSEENVRMLNDQFPEIASSLRDTSDLYSKAVSAYNIMKRFGIHKDDPHSQDRIKALRNTQKPKPVTSISPQQGDSPLSKANAFANGLTEDLKAQLRREMSAARRGA